MTKRILPLLMAAAAWLPAAAPAMARSVEPTIVAAKSKPPQAKPPKPKPRPNGSTTSVNAGEAAPGLVLEARAAKPPPKPPQRKKGSTRGV